MAKTNILPEGSTWEAFKLTNVVADTTVNVTFAEDSNGTGVPDKYEEVTVNAIAGENGTVNPTNTTVIPGGDVTITIAPSEGYAVDEITVGDTTYVNDPDFGKAKVSSSEDIAAAATNPEISTIEIEAPISQAQEIQFDKPMTINGNNQTVTQTTTGKTYTLTQDSTVEDIIIESTADNTEWHSSYGLQFYTGAHTVKNATLKGGNAGIIVNGATVTLEGTIDVSGNTFGGIEVCKGSNPALTAGVLNINGANIINTTEEYGKPTIWIDGNTDEEGIVNGADAFTMVEVPHGDTTQKQYYLDPAHAVAP